ncbi:acetylxylan esterase [Acrasis kona]|uniref:Acetylxylan esterase n=1 Tax=Acrasis kona TaxID=1008807 RepID=A0AAW2ZAJ8_9EUKA
MQRGHLLISLLLLFFTQICFSEFVRYNLWPDFAPGETTKYPGTYEHGQRTFVRNVTQPQFFMYKSEQNRKNEPSPAVIVLPGGGYEFLTFDAEGTEVAAWLSKHGFITFVLNYRVPRKMDGAYQDMQRMISYLRTNAATFNINPNKIGVIGFSAGGHLAVRMAVSDGKRTYEPIDGVDKQSFLPNFALPIYPAFLLDDKKKPTSIVQPRIGSAPMFIEQSLDDPFLCAVDYAKALKEAKLDYELVIYEKGGHGYGLHGEYPVSQWPERALKWLSRFL